MEIPVLSQEEKARLEAVHALGLLDTEPEERFDRLCRLASEIFQTPVAYVALMDQSRHWFKATCGLAHSETPREGTFCDYAILKPQPTIILDASKDAQFCNSPYVAGEPFVRFYMGHPLAPNGIHTVGTLCVLSPEPRAEVSEHELNLFSDLARIAEAELNLKDTLEAHKLLRRHQSDLKKHNEFVRKVLGRYVTEEVAEVVLSSPENLHLGGERREVTIMMTDLRGFTPMSDRLPPETVVTILNHYLHCMVDIVLKWGGTLDEIIGDALLVIFGAPLSQEDHAQRAAQCALEMQLAMDGLNELLESEGLPRIQCGVGLNTGEVVVGNIGSEKRMKYSVVGSPVNLAARIESLTIGGQILLSERTREVLGDEARLDGKIRVKLKGYDKPVKIFELGGFRELQMPDTE